METMQLVPLTKVLKRRKIEYERVYLLIEQGDI